MPELPAMDPVTIGSVAPLLCSVMRSSSTVLPKPTRDTPKYTLVLDLVREGEAIEEIETTSLVLYTHDQ